MGWHRERSGDPAKHDLQLFIDTFKKLDVVCSAHRRTVPHTQPAEPLLMYTRVGGGLKLVFWELEIDI